MEEQNILSVQETEEEFAMRKQINLHQFQTFISTQKNILQQARLKRVKPSLDDKIILSWNALMTTALVKAYEATLKEEYKSLAEAHINKLLVSFSKPGCRNLFRIYKEGKNKIPAFLEDYSFLIASLIDVYQISSNEFYLQKALEYTEYVIENFEPNEEGFFEFSDKNYKEDVVSSKEVHDGATPSSNAVMAYNLVRLGLLFSKTEWVAHSQKMILLVSETVKKYPQSYSYWASLLLGLEHQYDEITILGAEASGLKYGILQKYLPFKVLKTIENANKTLIPESEKFAGKLESSIYICKGFTCFNPVHTTTEAIQLITEQNRKS